MADLHVLVEPATKPTAVSGDAIDQIGAAARRALAFERAPTVWRIDGRALSEATAAPYPAARMPAPEALAAAGVLREVGVDVIVEHGEVLGEILGLEMARVVVDEHGARVEVGVGRHDREAFAMLHGDVPTAAALASVVDTVRRHRTLGSPPHPLNRLASERWLRGLVIAEPGLVGAVELSPVEPTTPRISVKDAAPAAAVGVDAAGRSIVVVCSTGIDLDLVPAAADIRLGHAPDARLVLVVPERDAHPVTLALAAALRRPAKVVLAPPAGRR